MSANKQVLTLIREMNKFYKKRKGKTYPDADGKSSLWDMYQEDIQEVMENPDKYYMIDDYLKALSEWYLKYSQYARVHLNDSTLQKTAFAQSAWCGYQAVKVKGEFNRFRNPLAFSMDDVLLFWSNCILAGWFDEAADIGERCIRPPEAGGGLIEEGWSFDRASWFLLELHSRWQHDASLDRSLFANYPDTDSELFIYSDILKHWNTPDIDQVNGYINRMADYHLTQTAEVKDPDEEYFEFNNTYNRLYPYEIMAWLKLREHLGIPNPTQFNHALMNQPLAEFIQGTPLEKPQMEQVNALLAIVRNALPEAEI